MVSYKRKQQLREGSKLLITVCLKKMPLKEMCDFITLNGTIGSGVDQNKYHHLFDPFLKTPLFQWKIVSSHEKLKFLM